MLVYNVMKDLLIKLPRSPLQPNPSTTCVMLLHLLRLQVKDTFFFKRTNLEGKILEQPGESYICPVNVLCVGATILNVIMFYYFDR